MVEVERRRQRTWPKPTSRWFISLWNSVGNHDCRLSLNKPRISEGQNSGGFSLPGFFGVFRGRLMPFESVGDAVHVDVYADAHVSNFPIITRREESRERETHISHAACKHRKAILGPTPGSEHSSSTVFGTSESNSSRKRCAACLMYLRQSLNTKNYRQQRFGETDCVFRRQKPTLLMHSVMTCSSAASNASRLSVPPNAARSLSTAASVTSSLVCEESMSDMSVAKRLFWHPNLSQCEEELRGGGGGVHVDPSPSTWQCHSPLCQRAQASAPSSPVLHRRSRASAQVPGAVCPGRV